MRVHYWFVFIIATTLLWGSGCGSTAEEVQKRNETQSQAPSEADLLFDAVVEEFEARGLETKLSSREYLVNASDFEQVNSELRRRVIARIIVFSRGIALNVTSEYQRLNRSEKPAVWVEATDELTLKRARKDESELGASIQNRFKEKR